MQCAYAITPAYGMVDSAYSSGLKDAFPVIAVFYISTSQSTRLRSRLMRLAPPWGPWT